MNSKNKGSTFERLICKKLSLWITNNQRDDILWRSIGSGSFHSSKKRITKTQAGDIAPIDPLGEEFINKYTIECKSYKQIDLYNLFNNKSIINKWLDKLNEEIKEINTRPLIIMKQNNKDILILMNEYTFLNSYKFDDSIYIKINQKNKNYYIMKFDYFIDNNVYGEFIEA